MSELVSHATDDSFEDDVLSATQPVLVDFWAEWCGPCKMITPIIEEIATEYKDRVKVVKVNIDDNPQAPMRYNVRGIPTLLLFRTGNVEATHVGALSKSQLAAFLDSHL